MKIFTYIFAAMFLTVCSTTVIKADEPTAGSSASLKINSEVDVFDYHGVSGKHNVFDYRVLNLRTFLEKYNSPLSGYAQDFVDYADTYGIDYRLVPAISGVESTFGKHIPYKSYNAYGWANGEYKFTSWEDSIDHVSMTLKTKYIDKGAPSVAKIAKRYAPPSATWGKNVTYFMSKIDVLPSTFDI